MPEAEKAWLAECDAAAEGSLFKETASWIFGCNVPGKKYAIRFYFGGLRKYYEALQSMVDEGYRGFKPLAEGHQATDSRAETHQPVLKPETRAKRAGQRLMASL